MVVLLFAAALRIVTMLGYRPGRIYWYDTYTYIQLALDLRPRMDLNPSGYPFLLRLLLPFHSVPVVVGVQHLMGLGVGVMIYGLLRRKGLPSWGAALATVPGLFDASFLRLEHAVLGDEFFIFLVVAGVVALMRSPTPTILTGTVAGLCLAWAALTRTVGLPILLLALAYLAVRRVGWRPLAVTALAGLLPLTLYATWYRSEHGSFRLVAGDGAALWARSMTFAKCDRIKPPPAELPLCPNGTWKDAAEGYFWAPEASLNRMPGGREKNEALARSFALHAIAAQPFDYLRTVAGDVSLAFPWTPVAHPARTTPAFGFAGSRAPDPVPPWASSALRAYDPGATGGDEAAEPYAGFLRVYQYPAYLRGPYLAAIILLGLPGLRRGRSLLPWVTATALLVLPVAVLDFDHRYVLPVIPLACLAAGLAFVPSKDRAAAA
ncbi:hypothetical protein GCM10017600_28830 [Streptosporangium carneum]|uniref:ArnT-like N-terminal domain-containing protein n=1 Tax=Streptosporangium carneum TaxID=47481 RepID=A0A9W6MCX2_9ACTN|nr:hypothetical protein GCM10017600_28830 [Streptosporangium carneum]